jgi:hypothetical protein
MNVIAVPGHHVCDGGLASNNDHDMCRGRMLVRMKPVTAEVDQIRRVIDESEAERVGRAYTCVFYGTYSAVRGRPACCTATAGCWQKSATCNPLTQATELPSAAIEMHAEATQGQGASVSETTIGRARNPAAPAAPKAPSPARLRRCTECNVPVRREVDKEWTATDKCEACVEKEAAEGESNHAEREAPRAEMQAAAGAAAAAMEKVADGGTEGEEMEEEEAEAEDGGIDEGGGEGWQQPAAMTKRARKKEKKKEKKRLDAASESQGQGSSPTGAIEKRRSPAVRGAKGAAAGEARVLKKTRAAL